MVHFGHVVNDSPHVAVLQVHPDPHGRVASPVGEHSRNGRGRRLRPTVRPDVQAATTSAAFGRPERVTPVCRVARPVRQLEDHLFNFLGAERDLLARGHVGYADATAGTF